MVFMKLMQKSLAEFVGTFALVFAGCGSLMVSERFPGSIHGAAVPVVFGLVVAAMVYAVGHISGAHFNPAVTVAFAAARHFPAKDVLAYCAAQFAGALAAAGVLAVILPQGRIFGAAIPAVAALPAFLMEMLLAFFLMFVITAVATDTRAVGTMAGSAIGATVMLCAFVGGPVTGASMNPARWLAPALFQGEVRFFAVYLIAPFAGTCAGALAYELMRCERPKDDAGPKGCC